MRESAMRSLRLVLLLSLMAIAGMAHAMEGVFDRSQEVEKYTGLMSTATPDTLAVVAKEISVSGIADPQLAAALNQRLLNDYRSISKDRPGDTYGVWMVRALASFGLAEYSASLNTVASGANSSKVRSAAREALPTIIWNRGKNEVMSSRQYHNEGDDPAASRLMNLLMSDNYSYKHYAAERMNWDRILDKRLMAAIALQLQQYVDHSDMRLTNEQDETIASFAKLLGYSKNVQYRPLLENLLASSNISKGVRRHAKYALDKLF